MIAAGLVFKETARPFPQYLNQFTLMPALDEHSDCSTTRGLWREPMRRDGRGLGHPRAEVVLGPGTETPFDLIPLVAALGLHQSSHFLCHCLCVYGFVPVEVTQPQCIDNTDAWRPGWGQHGEGDGMFWGWEEKPCLFLESLIARPGDRASVHIRRDGQGGVGRTSAHCRRGCRGGASPRAQDCSTPFLLQLTSL